MWEQSKVHIFLEIFCKYHNRWKKQGEKLPGINNHNDQTFHESRNNACPINNQIQNVSNLWDCTLFYCPWSW